MAAPLPGNETVLGGTTQSPLDILDGTGAVNVDAAEQEWLDQLDVYADELEQGRFERLAFFAGNQIAEDALARSMTTELGRHGIDAVMVITATAPGAPRQTFVDTAMAPVATAEGPTATTECVYALPHEAIERTAMRCDFLMARARDTAEVETLQQVNDHPLPDGLMDVVPDGVAVLTAYEDAAVLGLAGATEDVLGALRQAGVCDREASEIAMVDPRDRGLNVGRDALRAAVRRIEAQTPNTQCDFTNAIARPALDEVRAQVPTLRESNPLCAGFEANDADAAVRYASATERFNDAVPVGIEEAYAQELTRLANSWVCVPPPPPPPPVHVAPGAYAPPPPAAPGGPALVPVYAVCIPNGCGGCVKIDWDTGIGYRDPSFLCMQVPQWTAISGGLSCSGGVVVGYDSPANAASYNPASSYDALAYRNSVFSILLSISGF